MLLWSYILYIMSSMWTHPHTSKPELQAFLQGLQFIFMPSCFIRYSFIPPWGKRAQLDTSLTSTKKSLELVSIFFLPFGLETVTMELVILGIRNTPQPRWLNQWEAGVGFTEVSPESQNHLGWKGPLRSWNPTINPALNPNSVPIHYK